MSLGTSDFNELHVSDNISFKGFVYFLYDNKSQIYIKLTWFKDIDMRKLPLKYYLLRCCSF